MSVHRTRRSATAACGLLLATVALRGTAGGSEADAPAGDRGAFLFNVYCASCHGPEARGDGPVAEALRQPPPDLTRIAARHGAFDPVRVGEIVDGRMEIPPHGPREMPVWGLTFQDPSRPSDQEAEVQERLQALVRYLERIQEDGP